jgi:hypothetical protein
VKRAVLTVLVAIACKRETATATEDEAKPIKTKKPEASAPRPKSSDEAIPMKPPRVPDFAKRKTAIPAIEDYSEKSAKLAGKDVAFTMCALDVASPLKGDSFTAVRDLALAPDGTIYIVDARSRLRRYVNQDPDGCDLALDPSFGKDGILSLDADERTFERVGVDADGTVFVGGTLFSKKVRDGVVSNWCGSSWPVAAHWDTLRVYSDGKPARGDCSEQRLELDGRKDDPYARILNVSADGVAATATVDSGGSYRSPRAGFYDFNGREKLFVGGPKGDDHLWSSIDVFRCGPWLCVVDLNASAVRAWAMDGSFVGAVDLDGALKMNVAPFIGDASTHDLWIGGTGPEKNGSKSVGFVARAARLY